jgi:hypothetical protein
LSDRRRQRARLRSAALVCVLSLVATAPATAGSEPQARTLVGADGLVYDSAPPVVLARRGELYLGLELDRACALGRRFDRGVRRIGKLARTIEASGRTVVLLIPPNKSTVMTGRLGELPHGRCDRLGLRHQARLLARYADPAYLPLLGLLQRQRTRLYWRTDQHWTSNATALMARAVARRLDPELAPRQSFEPVEQTTWGLLNRLLGDPATETVAGRRPDGRTVVRSGGSRSHVLPGITFDHRWTSSPASRTWPGHSLVLGDSFAFVGLENLRPVFRRGRFLWVGHTSHRVIAEAVADADTVVIEAVQVLVAGNELGSVSLRRQVRRSLGR